MRRPGFTLIELLICTGIFAVLVGVLGILLRQTLESERAATQYVEATGDFARFRERLRRDVHASHGARVEQGGAELVLLRESGDVRYRADGGSVYRLEQDDAREVARFERVAFGIDPHRVVYATAATVLRGRYDDRSFVQTLAATPRLDPPEGER